MQIQSKALSQVPLRGRILLVDDDPGLLRLLSIRLRAEHYDVEAVESAAEALAALSRFRPDLVVTDLRMDNMDGIQLLKEIQRQRPGLCVLLLTAHGTIPDAVEATQSGAFGFLTKPVDKQQLLEYVERAMKVSGMPKSTDEWSAEIITRSPAMEGCLQQARMVANTETRVLITGESGTGKELLARAVHRASTRKDQPFVAINCSAMAENLLESELFGHVKGAFTGADRTHKGLFQAAHGGTLLLDEIGDMPMRLQVKLLRVLQEEQVRPVGSTEAITSRHAGDFRHAPGPQGPDDQGLVPRGPLLPAQRREHPSAGAARPQRGRSAASRALPAADLDREQPGAQGLRTGGRRVAGREPLARQHSPALQRRAAERRASARCASSRPSRSGARLGEQANALPSFSEARDEFTRNYLSQLLQITGGNVSQAARLAKRNRTDFYKLLGRHQLNAEQFKDGR